MKIQEQKTFRSLTIFDVLYTTSDIGIHTNKIENITLTNSGVLQIKFHLYNTIDILEPSKTSFKNDRHEVFVNYSKAYDRHLEKRLDRYNDLVEKVTEANENLYDFVLHKMINDNFKLK